MTRVWLWRWMAASMPNLPETLNVIGGLRKTTFGLSASGTTMCFLIWRAFSQPWPQSSTIPLTRRLACARRHPLPQGEREEKKGARDDGARGGGGIRRRPDRAARRRGRDYPVEPAEGDQRDDV